MRAVRVLGLIVGGGVFANTIDCLMGISLGGVATHIVHTTLYALWGVLVYKAG